MKFLNVLRISALACLELMPGVGYGETTCTVKEAGVHRPDVPQQFEGSGDDAQDATAKAMAECKRALGWEGCNLIGCREVGLVPSAPRPLEDGDQVSCGGVDGFQFEIVAGTRVEDGFARIFRNGVLFDAVSVSESYPQDSINPSMIEGSFGIAKRLAIWTPDYTGSYHYDLSWAGVYSNGDLICTWAHNGTPPLGSGATCHQCGHDICCR